MTGAATGALAVPVAPTASDGTLKVRTGRLVEVGPTAEHGFPAWYRDSNGVRLEACTTLDDPLCATLPDEVPDPDAPVSYPDNFPGEFFYQLAGATVAGPGVDMTVGMDLEGAWAAEEVVEGDQMVFGRVRIRDKSIADGEYRVTHPYGVDQFVVEGDGINYTQDIGTTPGAFGQALASRVGPFLRWDPAVAPAAPAGYVGDPGVEHEVVGSPYGTNFVAVERRDGDGAGPSWRAPPRSASRGGSPPTPGSTCSGRRTPSAPTAPASSTSTPRPTRASRSTSRTRGWASSRPGSRATAASTTAASRPRRRPTGGR